MDPIPYGKQDITAKDIECVINALKSPFLTQGPIVDEFEKAFSDYVGSEFAVAVSSGTAALHLGVLSLGLGLNQKVVTTPLTFSASANCIRYCQGSVEFCDIDKSTYLMDLNLLEARLKKGGIVGVIPVNYAGMAIKMEELKYLAEKYGFWIIEDASHSPGAFYARKDKTKVYSGSCEFNDLSVFSFHPVKHIAAGEGGMITTNNSNLYMRLKSLRTHGIVKDSNHFKGVKKRKAPGWYMEMQELGYNYRLSDIHASLGLSQLKRANKNISIRRGIAEKYFNAFKEHPKIDVQDYYNYSGHAYHLFVIKVSDRLGLYNFLKARNIFTQVHYIPVHLMPYYRSLGWKENDFPLAEDFYGKCLSLPIFPSLTNEEQEYVINSIKEFLK